MPSTKTRLRKPAASSAPVGADSTDATLQVRDRGVVTLPKALRDRYGLTAGDALRVLDLDGVFVVTPMVPMVPELAREIEKLRSEAGLSTEELLESLRRERERYAREHYGAEQGSVEQGTSDA